MHCVKKKKKKMEMLTDTHSPRDSWKKAALKAMSRETFFFFFFFQELYIKREYMEESELLS